MKWSLFFGKISGIKLYVHWTFLILIVWILLLNFREGNSMNEGMLGVAFVLVLFVCVVLHELGHAITAKKFGIKTRNIILLPIGGLANMERLPERPKQELLVALMGPAMNILIAFVLYIFLISTDGLLTAEELLPENKEEHIVVTIDNFLYLLMLSNMMLAFFNLIPAFPMDGGRVLRALLSYQFSRSRATHIAASIGQVLAILFVFAGFFTNFWLVFIGIFIFLGAGGEASYEANKHILSDFKVKDVSIAHFTILPPQLTLENAAQKLLYGLEQEFLVGEDNSVLGILTRKSIIKGLSEFGKDAPISNFLQKDFLELQPEMKLKEVFHKMMSNGCSIAPVYNEARLVGVVDRENINELIMVNQALANN